MIFFEKNYLRTKTAHLPPTFAPENVSEGFQSPKRTEKIARAVDAIGEILRIYGLICVMVKVRADFNLRSVARLKDHRDDKRIFRKTGRPVMTCHLTTLLRPIKKDTITALAFYWRSLKCLYYNYELQQTASL